MELEWSGHLTGESDGTPSPAAGIIGACHRRLACCLTTGAGPPRHRYRPGTGRSPGSGCGLAAGSASLSCGCPTRRIGLRWLLRYQGQGIGTAMRAAALTLAFDGLGAEFALSAAFTDNPASLAVSRKLGYRDDGMKRQVIRGRPAELRRLRLDRAAWARRDSGTGHGEVMIEGLDPCLPLFGLARAPRHLTP